MLPAASLEEALVVWDSVLAVDEAISNVTLVTIPSGEIWRYSFNDRPSQRTTDLMVVWSLACGQGN